MAEEKGRCDMANFCPNCGKPVNSSDMFCENCGSRIAAGQAQPQQAQWTPPRQAQPQQQWTQPQQNQQWAQQQQQQQWAQQQQAAAWQTAGGNVRMGVPAPGYSTRINDPEILKAMRKSRNISKLFVPIIVPLPLIGFVVYANVTGEMDPEDAFKYGLFVSAVFLIFALYSFAKERAKNTYEAVVTDKKILNQRKKLTAAERRNRHDDDNQIREKYVTYIRRSDGKNDKIVETTPTKFSAWQYLQVGDRYMYHPQLHFPYEKYDKTRESHLYCVSCLKANPITNDRCSKCGVPLLK